MKKKLLSVFLVLLSLLFYSERSCAQFLEPRLGIYFSNPVGLISKGGGKIEFRINPANAVLFNYTQYWGFFPGSQGYLEYRKYFNTKSFAENFLYGKLGVGYADYKPGAIIEDGSRNYSAPGTYVLGGGGVGRHINFGAFFLDLNMGLKITALTSAPPVYNQQIFYSLGPGAVLDLNFHFGFQL